MKRLLNIPKFVLWVSMLMLLISSCRKDNSFESDRSSPLNEYRNWLNKNGGAFKSERIRLKKEDRTFITGNLAWDKGIWYEYKGRKYVEIPFLFDGKISISQDTSAVKTTFSLVFRKAPNGKIEAAILIYSYGNVLTDESGRKSQGAIKSYNLINGEPSTLWLSMGDINHFKKIKRESADFSLKSENPLSYDRAMGCITYSFTDWVSYSYGGYDEIVVEAYPVISFYTICFNETEMLEENSDWGGGGGSGGSAEDENQSQQVAVSDYTSTESETFFSDEDMSSDGNYVPIVYKYRSQIFRSVPGGVIQNVILYDTFVDNAISTYIDKYGRTITRVVTTLDHLNSYKILEESNFTLADCFWSCSVNAIYKTNNTIFASRNWSNKHNEIR
ncbi:MAG: hypothetical protein J0H55_16075 [Chitinophagaceae bacterium]|nr:hypothetical protein [Chitinophagaceae bacterium]